MFKIFIEKVLKNTRMETLTSRGCYMKPLCIILLAVFLMLNALVVCAQTTFNGELFANFAKPVGATFRLYRQGQLVSTNQGGLIDFGNLSYNSTIGLWIPAQACGNSFSYCYRLTVNMEPFGVMGDFNLNVQYSDTNNPNSGTRRHGLGRKVAMTVKSCETLAGANGSFDCVDAINFGGANVTAAVLLDQISSLGGVAEYNTTNYFQMEFFVNTFSSNVAIWNSNGQSIAEAFTNSDHHGDYEGTLVVTATYN